MLDLLRGFSKGWTAKILIALLVLSFAIWGISGSLFFGSQNTVVAIGETRVDVQQFRFAYESQLNSISRNVGRQITRQEADAMGFRQNVLNQMITGAVLDENARKMGLGVSDENLADAIGKDPVFHDLSGNFSRTLLRNTLRNAGLSEADYLNRRRNISSRNQIMDSVTASMRMPEVYADAFARYRDEKRIFEYVTIGKEVAGEIGEPETTILEEYYEENKAFYVAPEYRKLAILKLEPADLSKPDNITGEELRSIYENRKDKLKTPEKREIEQLVLKTGTQDEVLEKLRKGTAFTDIITEQGKTLADINLGLLTREELPDGAVAKAAFEAELNKPTDIVEGAFGPVLIRVIKIEPESVTAYEDIVDELREQIATEQAVEDVFAGFDAIEEERGAGESVIATGEKLNYETTIIEAVDSTGLDPEGNSASPLPARRELLREAFAAQPGDDTQSIEFGENGFVWYEVLDITPSRQKSFEEVRERVLDEWKSEEIDRQISATVETIRARVQSGEAFNTVIAEVLPKDSLGKKASLSETQALQRSGQESGLPSAAIRKGFGVKEGELVISKPDENSQILLRTKSVENDSAKKIDEETTKRINEAVAQDILTQLVMDMQSREEVLINQSAVELALSQGIR